MEISPEYKAKIDHWLKIILIAFLIVFITNVLFKFIPHSKYGNKSENTITFSGHGEVFAVPDIANIYFTINKESKTVKEAQTLVAEIEKKSLDFLKENNILEKDIKTSNASFNPKYDYGQVYCITYPCPQRNPKIIGYEASESITIKIRNTDDVGKIIQGLGTLGVSNLNGPNFSIDNEDGLKTEARKKAIDDAKVKAAVLAKDLGVRLGKITSFSESGNYPVPMYAKTMMAREASDSSAPAQIPKGENTISSDVSITYEIR